MLLQIPFSPDTFFLHCCHSITQVVPTTPTFPVLYLYWNNILKVFTLMFQYLAYSLVLYPTK